MYYDAVKVEPRGQDISASKLNAELISHRDAV